MSSALNLAGFYGKVPTLGDFVSRRLQTSFVRTWDAWLQSSLLASTEQLGRNWLDVYLTSPIWRFVLSPGNCGDNAWAGIMMPSVDRVGRYFPLTLAAQSKKPEALPCLFVTAAGWFDELERLALSALQDNFNLDEFDQKLQASPLLQPTAEICRGGSIDVGGNGRISCHIEMESLEDMPKAYMQLSAGIITKFWPIYSLWSSTGSERVKPSFWAYDGLPPIEVYAELLSGRGQQGGWSDGTVDVPLTGSGSNDLEGECDEP